MKHRVIRWHQSVYERMWSFLGFTDRSLTAGTLHGSCRQCGIGRLSLAQHNGKYTIPSESSAAAFDRLERDIMSTSLITMRWNASDSDVLAAQSTTTRASVAPSSRLRIGSMSRGLPLVWIRTTACWRRPAATLSSACVIVLAYQLGGSRLWPTSSNRACTTTLTVLPSACTRCRTFGCWSSKPCNHSGSGLGVEK